MGLVEIYRKIERKWNVVFYCWENLNKTRDFLILLFIFLAENMSIFHENASNLPGRLFLILSRAIDLSSLPI
jgi:hypothetical protein